MGHYVRFMDSHRSYIRQLMRVCAQGLETISLTVACMAVGAMGDMVRKRRAAAMQPDRARPASGSLDERRTISGVNELQPYVAYLSDLLGAG